MIASTRIGLIWDLERKNPPNFRCAPYAVREANRPQPALFGHSNSPKRMGNGNTHCGSINAKH